MAVGEGGGGDVNITSTSVESDVRKVCHALNCCTITPSSVTLPVVLDVSSKSRAARLIRALCDLATLPVHDMSFVDDSDVVSAGLAPSLPVAFNKKPITSIPLCVLCSVTVTVSPTTGLVSLTVISYLVTSLPE